LIGKCGWESGRHVLSARTKAAIGPKAEVTLDDPLRRTSAAVLISVRSKPVKPKFAKPKLAKSKLAKSKPSKLKPSKLKSAATKPAAAKLAAKSRASKPGKPALHKSARNIGRLAAPNVTIGTSDPAVTKLKAHIRRLTGELSEARGRIEELESWAETDFLLDIPNRRGFERELHRAIAYIKRYHVAGALIVLDVDRLKPVNDAFGHAAGDAVLKGIVNVILRHVRSSDVIGRLGGDEFAVLLWNSDEADTRAKAAALEHAIDHLTFVFRGRSIASGA
jgi:diguanylate cyclase (GGDEF)-like protein